MSEYRREQLLRIRARVSEIERMCRDIVGDESILQCVDPSLPKTP